MPQAAVLPSQTTVVAVQPPAEIQLKSNVVD